VSRTPRLSREKSATPSVFSSEDIARDTVEWLI